MNEDRPIMSWKQLWSRGVRTAMGTRVLLCTGDFLKAVADLSGYEPKRRQVQFYSSPAARVMPQPRYKKRHTAFYSHPEDTLRLAVILHLRLRYFMPIKTIRQVLAGLPRQHYHLVLADAFTAQEILLLASEGLRLPPEDVIFKRVRRLLCVASWHRNSGFRRLVGPEEFAKTLDRFQAWLDRKPLPEIASTPAKNAASAVA